MNYLIYLGIFILGGMFCVVIMSLLYLGNEGSSIEGRIRENCDQNKLDEKFLSNNRQTLSALPPVKDADKNVLCVSIITFKDGL